MVKGWIEHTPAPFSGLACSEYREGKNGSQLAMLEFIQNRLRGVKTPSLKNREGGGFLPALPVNRRQT